jgi:hypothetical protein
MGLQTLYGQVKQAYLLFEEVKKAYMDNKTQEDVLSPRESQLH